jgi:hypothetical protein
MLCKSPDWGFCPDCQYHPGELPDGFSTMECAGEVSLWHLGRLVTSIDKHLATPEVLNALANAERVMA